MRWDKAVAERSLDRPIGRAWPGERPERAEGNWAERRERNVSSPTQELEKSRETNITHDTESYP